MAPPTPERLEQDKKSIDEQFDRTFALVEQLAKDTEALKAAEQERTERLDTALSDLESVMSDLKSANRRREDEAQRVRDDVQTLKDSIPKAMDTQRDSTDNRLREVNTELKSLKMLITQRMNPTATSTSVSNYLRPSVANPAPSSPGTESADVEGKPAAEESKGQDAAQDYTSSFGRSSPFSSGAPPSKASIPAWQLAMATKNAGSTSATNGAEAGASGS